MWKSELDIYFTPSQKLTEMEYRYKCKMQNYKILTK